MRRNQDPYCEGKYLAGHVFFRCTVPMAVSGEPDSVGAVLHFLTTVSADGPTCAAYRDGRVGDAPEIAAARLGGGHSSACDGDLSGHYPLKYCFV